MAQWTPLTAFRSASKKILKNSHTRVVSAALIFLILGFLIYQVLITADKFDRAVFKARRNVKTLRVGILSTYVPQKCGIAEFAFETLKALRSASLIGSSSVNVEVGVIVLNNEQYFNTPYENRASFVIRKNILEDFFAAAEFANSNFDVIICEHDYGLYGGRLGDYLFGFLDKLEIPFVATLHTILSRLDTRFLDMNMYDLHMRELIRRASWITVAIKSVCAEFESISPGVTKKCSGVPHGIPNFSPNVSTVRKKYGHLIENNIVILTAGLIGPTKGINFMIEAMKDVSKAIPNAKYFIVGQEHPLDHLNYHEALLKLVDANGVKDNVQFVVEFLSKRDLEAWISLADVIVLPYIDPGQVSSGSLSMSAGLGKPVIASRFRHSIELCLEDSLAEKAWNIEAAMIENGTTGDKTGLDGRYCRLVDRNSKDQLAATVIDVLNSKSKLQELAQLARERTRGMSWDDIGKKLIPLFQQVIEQDKLSKKVGTSPKPSCPLIGGPVKDSDRQEIWSKSLAYVRNWSWKWKSLEAEKLTECLKSSGHGSSLCAYNIHSLSYKGLLFSRWQPPAEKFDFTINKHGIFALRDGTKTVFGSLKDGAVFVSHTEHGMVFGRGAAVSWPSLEMEFSGRSCQSLDQRRNLTWSSQVSEAKAVLTTQTRVVCINEGSEVVVALLKNVVTVKLNQPFLDRTVTVEFPNKNQLPHSWRVLTGFFHLSSQHSGVHYTRFLALFKDSRVQEVNPTQDGYKLYQKSDKTRLEMYMLTNKEGKKGIFFKTKSASRLDLILCWGVKGEEAAKQEFMMEDFYHRYSWSHANKSRVKVKEEIMFGGRVDPTKLSVYASLFKQLPRWTGVDLSLAGNKEEVIGAMESYARTLPKSGSEAKRLQEWLLEQESS